MNEPITYERDGQWCAWGVIANRVIVALGSTKAEALKEWYAKQRQEAANGGGK